MLRFGVWLSGLVAMLPAVAPLCAGDAGTDPAAALDHAVAAAEARLRKGDRSGAEALYRRALFEGWLLRASLDRGPKRLPAAREGLAKAAAVAPDDPPALRSLATAQLQFGEVGEAEQLLTRLAAREPRDVESRRLLAKAQAAAGRLDAAVTTLDEASVLAGDDPEQSFLLATEYLWLKRTEAAARLFARIASARPIPQTHVLIGRAYRDAGEYDRAAASLQAAIAQDPSVRRAHYYLGMVLLADARSGAARRERAIAEFRAELALAPGDALANDQLGNALLDDGRPAEALPALEAAARGDARAVYLLHLGRCQLALDRPQDGVESLRRALALAGEQGAPDSDLEKIHYQLGLGLRKLGAGVEAAAHLGEARRLASAAAAEPTTVSPSDTSPLSELTPARREELASRADAALARSYFNLGLLAMQEPAGVDAFDKAAGSFEAAAAVDPAFPRVQSALGVAYFNARRFEDATGALAKALAQQPDDAGARRMLALSWINTEAWEKAVPLLREDPEREMNASLQLAYGVALARTGRAADAVGPLEAAARLAPEQADVQLELGRVYEQLGQGERARRSFEAYQRLKSRPPGTAQ
jgi:tetratricopeptide (TPR) repeat protein